MAFRQKIGSSLEIVLRTPRVSICIPTFKQLDYLQVTLSSVQAQDFEDYELIISDDTPDDSVKKLVDSFGFDERLHYYHNPVALGSPENWNAAIRYARGEYIKLLHHDDCFSVPNALGQFVLLLDQNPHANFAFSASNAVNITQGLNHRHCPSQVQVNQLLTTPENLFLKNLIGAPSATIYRNGLNLIFDNHLKWLVDVDFYIRLLQKNPNFVYTTDILINAANNASHQITGECKNNPKIDFFEHLYLYQKIQEKISSDSRLKELWFRLFERYNVYSGADLETYGAELRDFDRLLDPFFKAYHEVSFKRLPYRTYLRMPELIKNITKFIYYKVGSF